MKLKYIGLMTLCLFGLLACKSSKIFENKMHLEKNSRILEMIARKGKGIYVCDHRRNNLADAAVKINGKIMPYDQDYDSYRLLEDVNIPTNLVIEHQLYPKFIKDRFYFNTDIIYLMNENSFGFWRNGIEIPIDSLVGTYYIYFNNQYLLLNDEIEILKKEVNDLFPTLNLKIEKVVFENKFNEIFFHTIELSNLSEDQIDENKFLSTLSELESIENIGPLIKETGRSAYEASALTNILEIKFVEGISIGTINSYLKEFEIQIVEHKKIDNCFFVKAEMENEKGWKIINITKILNENPIIEFANNELFQQLWN